MFLFFIFAYTGLRHYLCGRYVEMLKIRSISLALTIVVIASLILLSCVPGRTTTSRTTTKGSVTITNIDVVVKKNKHELHLLYYNRVDGK
jgi:hypothetical protein